MRPIILIIVGTFILILFCSFYIYMLQSNTMDSIEVQIIHSLNFIVILSVLVLNSFK